MGAGFCWRFPSMALLEAHRRVRHHVRARAGRRLVIETATSAPTAERWHGWSTHRRRVLQSTLAPQGVQATLDLQVAALTNVALEDFAVVAHLFHDLHRPVLRQLQVLA